MDNLSAGDAILGADDNHVHPHPHPNAYLGRFQFRRIRF
eukprot:CAMPEP_0198242556 /NCGR_PEP_ID=MMETSP1446-20131203/17562_1 /TAXON_ID=1461542 ORGANISM="Unidentified sp, Strain CCMP2111" /NCGR_SAMPLE_ID=MMETSP1446 /ASSEMBLY_ACC=CAM_ASM_001112 /LENGTH=38 /DNA_ID= /DNA_START= /DNA_END= /DNA_ORIENTATION=